MLWHVKNDFKLSSMLQKETNSILCGLSNFSIVATERTVVGVIVHSGKVKRGGNWILVFVNKTLEAEGEKHTIWRNVKNDQRLY